MAKVQALLWGLGPLGHLSAPWLTAPLGPAALVCMGQMIMASVDQVCWFHVCVSTCVSVFASLYAFQSDVKLRAEGKSFWCQDVSDKVSGTFCPVWEEKGAKPPELGGTLASN